MCDSPESKMELGVLRGLGWVSPNDTMQCRGIKDVLKNAVLSSVVYVYTYVPRFVVQNVTYTLPTYTYYLDVSRGTMYSTCSTRKITPIFEGRGRRRRNILRKLTSKVWRR